MRPHVGIDAEVDRSKHKEVEKVLNAHGISWSRILAAGQFIGHEDRIKDNMRAHNCAAPPLYGLRKDHKVHEDEVVGPPSRPVCGANSSVNYRLSHLLSIILSEVWQRDRSGSVCMNTEEMMSDISRVNCEGLNDKTVVGSTDVKALYPSLDIPFTIEVVGDVFYNSNVNIAGVDNDELGLYISLNRSVDEINALGLRSMCPTRKHPGKRMPEIWASGTEKCKEKRWKPWNSPVVTPNEGEQRSMLKEALKIGMSVVMNNHMYTFDGRIHRQESGGSIGLELTGNIAQVYMIWWDRTLKSRLAESGILVRLMKRYVDDVNLAAQEVPLGARYEDGRLVIKQEEIEGDMLIPGDRRTMEIVRDIGNSIHPSIQLEVDYPSNYEDGKMPLLDLKVWVQEGGDGSSRIVHEFYTKDVSSKSVINAKSAFSWRQKRTVLTQELLRVLLNCSPDIPWDRVITHANTMVLRMQYSGYSKKFRHEVVNAALKAYDEIQRKAKNGERPLYRPYDWNREERDKAKKNKVNDWYGRGGYQSVIFVPSTPGSVLQQRYQSEVDRQGLRIRVVEKAGRSIKSMIQRSDPFQIEKCDRQSCMVCQTSGKGSCDKEGVTYSIHCVEFTERGKEKVYYR